MSYDGKLSTEAYVMRHAPTSQNKETPGKEVIRGWGDVGLGADGKAVAERAADFLMEHLKGDRPQLIISSDLPRAFETAQIVGKRLGAPVLPMRDLRTWNVGSITGKPVDTAKPELDRLQHESPNTPAPKGESYRAFLTRWGQQIHHLQEAGRHQPVLAVVHGRQVYAAPNLLSGKGAHGIPTSGPPNPGDVLRLDGGKLTRIYDAGAAARATT